MKVKEGIELILSEVSTVLAQPLEADSLLSLLKDGKRVFVVGQGRSGLAARMFAMRLVHLGMTAYVVGETVTPAIRPGDLLLACSGSGETKKVLLDATEAKKAGAIVVGITANRASALGTVADAVVCFPGSSNKMGPGGTSRQFGGSLFEQLLVVFFDAVSLTLQNNLKVDSDAMSKTHTNLE